MKIAFILFILFGSSVTHADEICSKSPADAFGVQRAAYKIKSIEESIRAIDFNEWARFNTAQAGVEINAEELKQEYVKQLTKSGFPDYRNLSCKVSEIQKQGFMVVEENCEFDGGGSYKQSVVAVKTGCGWKLAGPYLPNKAITADR